MLSFFRKFFQSKIGLPIFIGFLVIVALAFAAADITGSSFGGVSGGDNVAAVGDDTISATEFSRTLDSALRTVQDQNPTVSMTQFIGDGGFDEVLSQMIDRAAIGAYAEMFGLRAGDNLVNSEILKLGAFTGPTGEFDQKVYEAALARQGLNDAILRRDLSDGLLAQQLLVPALAVPQMPEKAARQYAKLLLERRKGQIAFIPSFAFAPKGNATDAQLQAFYKDNRSRFVQPERRVLRYATFGPDNIESSLTPTAAEIKAFYDANAQRFAASETRDVTSFLVPTQEAANALVARIRGGASLEAAARTAGFTVSSTDGSTRAQLTSSLGAAVADSVFKAAEGSVADPARSSLGYYVARVDKVTRTPARTLAQATPEITEEVTAQKRVAALADLSAQIEEEVDSGTSLADVARDFGLEVSTTPPVLADGRLFGQQQTLNPVLARTLETAFQMEESEPQLAELVPGQQFVVFDVADITPSAAPPLAQVREQVEAAWRLAEGNKEARKVANRVLGKVRGKTAVSAALAAEQTQLPPVENIDLARGQLFAREQRPPPPLVLMFSMAQGSTKLYEAPNNIGWYLVNLSEIVTEDIARDNPILQQTRQQLAPAIAAEYTEQLTRAMRDAVGVERNEDAIAAVRQSKLGNTN